MKGKFECNHKFWVKKTQGEMRDYPTWQPPTPDNRATVNYLIPTLFQWPLPTDRDNFPMRCNVERGSHPFVLNWQKYDRPSYHSFWWFVRTPLVWCRAGYQAGRRYDRTTNGFVNFLVSRVIWKPNLRNFGNIKCFLALFKAFMAISWQVW